MKVITGLATLVVATYPMACLADTVLCKASVQDAHGIATGWIASDGQSFMPVRATFVFPSGEVAVEAEGYKLTKPKKLPEDTLVVAAQYGFAIKDNDVRISLEQAEIDGPAYTRPDGKSADPLFVVAADGNAVIQEEAVENDGALTLMLHPADGKSSKGDIYVAAADRPGLATAFERTSDLAIAAGDLKNGSAIYRVAIHMTDPDTRNRMIGDALKKAASAAPAGEGCMKAN